MGDAVAVTRFELLDLERRISERGLQLRRWRPATSEARPSSWQNAEPLTVHEEAVIRAALLAMVRIAP
jgi:hypothetical protein